MRLSANCKATKRNPGGGVCGGVNVSHNVQACLSSPLFSMHAKPKTQKICGNPFMALGWAGGVGEGDRQKAK